MPPYPHLTYDRIIITGASSGFGKSFAEVLAPCTKELILIARSKETLQKMATELTIQHKTLQARAIACDLTDSTARSELISTLLHLEGGNTLLINNAGVGDYGEFSDGEWFRTHQMLRLNIEALTHLSHALIPSMKSHGGDIINISSLAALLPIPDFAVYAASKAYVSSFSEALRLELKEHNIRVLAVCPGPVSTGFGKAARREGFTGNMMPARNAFDTSVATVINDAIKALKRRKATIYPGLKIRIVSRFLRIIPLCLLRWFMGKRPRRVKSTSNTPQ